MKHSGEGGEIEPQHGDSVFRQGLRNPAGSKNVHTASKAMREQRVCSYRSKWYLKACGQRLALPAEKIGTLTDHPYPLVVEGP